MRTVLLLVALTLVVTPALASTTCPPPEPIVNDVCEGAIPLGTDPLELTIDGNTQGAADDYDVGHGNSCTSARANGPDIVYSVEVSPGCILSATLSLCSPSNWYEQSLYLVSDCNDLLAECHGSDLPCGADGDCPPETAIWDNGSAATQTVFIILDGRTPSAGDAFHLEIATDCVVPVERSTWGAIKAAYGS